MPIQIYKVTKILSWPEIKSEKEDLQTQKINNKKTRLTSAWISL